MGNDQACKITGIRDVSLKLISGIERILTDVRHIHTLHINLISLGMLAKYGFEFKGYGNELRVIKWFMVYLRGKIRDGLYILREVNVQPMALVGEFGKELEL